MHHEQSLCRLYISRLRTFHKMKRNIHKNDISETLLHQSVSEGLRDSRVLDKTYESVADNLSWYAFHMLPQLVGTQKLPEVIIIVMNF